MMHTPTHISPDSWHGLPLHALKVPLRHGGAALPEEINTTIHALFGIEQLAGERGLQTAAYSSISRTGKVEDRKIAEFLVLHGIASRNKDQEVQILPTYSPIIRSAIGGIDDGEGGTDFSLVNPVKKILAITDPIPEIPKGTDVALVRALTVCKSMIRNAFEAQTGKSGFRRECLMGEVIQLSEEKFLAYRQSGPASLWALKSFLARQGYQMKTILTKEEKELLAAAGGILIGR